MGYAIKAYYEKALGWHNDQSIGFLSDYIRFGSCNELKFKYEQEGETLVKVEGDEGVVEATFKCSASNPREARMKINNARLKLTLFREVPPSLDNPLMLFLYLMQSTQSTIKPAEVLSSQGSGRALIWVPRLYSFDRFNVYLNVSRNIVSSQLPPNYLHENATNMAWILTQMRGVLHELNNILDQYVGVRVVPSIMDVKFMRRDEEVAHTALLASDTVVRLTYYLTALLSNTRKEVDGKVFIPILLLEEPEAHLSPLPFDKITELLSRIEAPVVITTHSPHLAASVFNNIIDTKVYFLRLEKGETKFYELKEPSFIFHDIIGKGDEVLDEMIKLGEAVCANCMESESVTSTR